MATFYCQRSFLGRIIKQSAAPPERRTVETISNLHDHKNAALEYNYQDVASVWTGWNFHSIQI